jgi:uracil-DNA glycosylase
MDTHQIENSDWKNIISNQFKKEYFIKLQTIVDNARKTEKIYPSEKNVFNAFSLSFENVKVIILGQNPYHQPNQAHGLSFSVLEPTKPPPSLINIYKELEADIIGWKKPNHGNLTSWLNQGVFLLNTSLTVIHDKPESHLDIGWKFFTTQVIQKLSDRGQCVFLLWGNHAKQFSKYIDETSNVILSASHPSPLSIKGFLGCKHFSKTNEALKAFNKKEIDWKLP